MRKGAVILIFALVLTAVSMAQADTETRCGAAAGVVLGATIPLHEKTHDEFDYLFRLELDAKYYLIWGLSLGGGLGYQYGEGLPRRIIRNKEESVLDAKGNSFWRAFPMFGTLRLEFWRYGVFNPYIGGGGGYTYLAVYRKGYELRQPISENGEEWFPHYFAMLGFDVALTKYLAIRVEGKRRWLPTDGVFFGDRDYGGVDILGGVNIYF